MGWRCIADAARLEEFRPADMASEGLRMMGMELLMLLSAIVAVDSRLNNKKGWCYLEGSNNRGGGRRLYPSQVKALKLKGYRF
mmetsp:Transcript_559/g.1289  ORF Transcript_559/g.1289 Transcript_559/m.1289 type:complete len:83 (+) Transcript_559:552-800(+)